MLHFFFIFRCTAIRMHFARTLFCLLYWRSSHPHTITSVRSPCTAQRFSLWLWPCVWYVAFQVCSSLSHSRLSSLAAALPLLVRCCVVHCWFIVKKMQARMKGEKRYRELKNGKKRIKKRWKIHSLIFRYFSSPHTGFGSWWTLLGSFSDFFLSLELWARSENIRGKRKVNYTSNFSKRDLGRCWTWSNNTQSWAAKKRAKK